MGPLIVVTVVVAVAIVVAITAVPVAIPVAVTIVMPGPPIALVPIPRRCAAGKQEASGE